ncbi:MAG TPA: sulfite exporter TauE/SafE family protein [Bryobacteraceae bacterium]|nr:sulfite exporter TauE/SafE family protein [Bryobacteraceae bacterium]
MNSLVILLAAAATGGAVNALAGGGTFLVFPALLLAGVAAIKANATASLALLPGVIVSAWVYRESVRSIPLRFILTMVATSVAGSITGSMLLMYTSNATFSTLVPWLLLMAAAVFTAAPWLRKAAAGLAGHQSMAVLMAGQFLVSTYGGYFGAGMGVLMMSLYLAASEMSVHTAAGLRTVCAAAINILAVAIFAWKGALNYADGIPMLVAGVVGGYLGALVVKKLNAENVRRGILIYAWGLTAWFFVKGLL